MFRGAFVSIFFEAGSCRAKNVFPVLKQRELRALGNIFRAPPHFDLIETNVIAKKAEVYQTLLQKHLAEISTRRLHYL